MSEIIIGDDAVDILNQVSLTLRSRTANLVNCELPDYSPWMCLYPTGVMPPERLLGKPDHFIGPVIMDEEYLGQVADFMDTNPELIQNHLIGGRKDWEIHVDVNQTRPEMGVELTAICRYICHISPFFGRVFDALVTAIIPLRQHRARGLSSDILRGAIFLGYPPGYSSMLLAMDVVHELGHQALSTLFSADPVFVSDPGEPVYSEIRHTERPALQSLHAAAAIAFMTHWVKDAGCPGQRHPDCPDDLSETLLKAIKSLREKCEFTDTGNCILDDFSAVALR